MKIGFTGTMSIGKTTLVKALKELPEFQNYDFAIERSKYLRDLGIPLNTDSTLRGQTVFLAERSLELMKENIITDRTIIDVIAFTKNAQSIDLSDKNSFEKYAMNLLKYYDYIFYISPKGVDLEDNGVRTIDHKYRDTIDKTIVKLLNKYTETKHIHNVYYIQGTTEERIKTIKETIFS